MPSRDIEYAFQGQTLRGFFASGEGRDGKAPGVLVVHDAGGLAEHIKDKARRLAGLGYAAFCLDLYGEGRTADGPQDGMARIQALGADIPRWRGLAKAGLDTLAAQPEVESSKLAAIGYCFGGTTVYELARSGAALKGVVGFHSGLSPKTEDDAKNIQAKVLTLIGAADPLIPPEARLAFERELTEAGVDWQITLYGGVGHSFTHPGMTGERPGFKYDAQADARSWAEMQRFFQEVFA